jgi:hypothetical protein
MVISVEIFSRYFTSVNSISEGCESGLLSNQSISYHNNRILEYSVFFVNIQGAEDKLGQTLRTHLKQ